LADQVDLIVMHQRDREVAMSQGGDPGSAKGGSRNRSVINVEESKADALRVLFGSGLLSAGRPDRIARRLGALARYGPTLAGSFAAAAARDPKRTALVDENRSVTYGEFDQRVRRIAAGLVEHGAGPGRAVAMLQRNSVYAVETMVATSRTGSTALLLNTFMSPAQVTEVLLREKPSFVFVNAELRANLADLPEGITVVVAAPGDGADEPGDLTMDDLARSTAPDVKAPEKPGKVIILTSGTTGTPKGANRGAPKGLGPAASILSRIKLKAPEIMMIAPPVFHTLGIGLLQIAPALNSTIVLRRKPDPESILEALATEKCTSAVIVPVMAQRMVDLPAEVRAQYDTSALKVAVCGSAALPPDVCSRFQDAFGDVLYNIYGTTECSWATIATPADLRAQPGTVGRPPMGTKLALLNENGKPVKKGDVGQIYVGNAMVFDGYTNGVDKTRINGLIPTGDLGQFVEDDLLMVLGRDDDMVIVGGENIYPIEVEDLLVARPEISEVVVTGVPDDKLGQRLAAYVVLNQGFFLSEDDVKELVKSRLARYSVPRDVIFLDELPRNTVGKVVPRLLPKPSSVPGPTATPA
jgi:acyl-CoA synthetase (AMP-forming)/AMP-acid ligase II